MLLKFHTVFFAYEQATEPLFEDLTVHFSPGWTGVTGANGTGKSTLLRLACGELSPARGRVQTVGRAVYCPQRTDEAPALLSDFLSDSDTQACRLRGRLSIAADWGERWSTLSFGERKRAQIGVALHQSPNILAVDEPGNHLDADARRLLLQALQAFSGIGLLVSHDREMLDDLCDSCLFVSPPGAVLRSGGYTAAARQAEQEQRGAAHRRDAVKQSLRHLSREHENRLRVAAQADRKRSKRNISKKDHDAKEKINRARLTGKDGRAGRAASQLEGRERRLRQTLESLRVEKHQRTGISLTAARSERDALFHLPSGTVALGESRSLQHPALHMAPADRIGITGANGAGKSSLVNRIVSDLRLPEGALLYLPQEIDVPQSKRIVSEARALSRDALGRVMTVVNRLGTRPHRLLETDEPSPGELRKLMLGVGIARSPQLILMDEPTNHLDLPAIECLEAVLADCACGLLLVSHDLVFLRRLTRIRWDLCDGRLTVLHGWDAS